MANTLAQLAQRRTFGFPGVEGEVFDIANQPQKLSNLLTNESLGYAPQGVPQQQLQMRGSPVDVFGQGKGFMQPDGTIVGVNQAGQQFKVQPEGTQAALMEQKDAALKRQMMQAQFDEMKAKAGQRGQMTPADILAREKFEWEKMGGKSNAKPLPATALKMQNEAVDAVGALSSLNADLGAVKSNLESGALDLGMFSNLINKARNIGGLSTEESRNLATFQSTLERLRNESLRLNKGVQTEGDAVRAWNEILANINDPQLVKQRLEEVMNTNQRAVELRKLEVDNIRSNYGHDPLDLTAQQGVKPALTKTRGATGDFGAPQSGYEQTATNPQTGQKIGLRNGKWEPIR